MGYKLALYLAVTATGFCWRRETMSEAVHDLGALRALREGAGTGPSPPLRRCSASRSRRCGPDADPGAGDERHPARPPPSGSHLTEQGASSSAGPRTCSTPPTGSRRGCGRSGQACRTGWRSPRARPSPSTWCRTGWSSCASSSRPLPSRRRRTRRPSSSSPSPTPPGSSSWSGTQGAAGFIETLHLPADLVTAPLATTRCSWSPRPPIRGPAGGGRCRWPRSPRRRWSCGRPAAAPGTRSTDHLAAQRPPLSARIAMELGTSAAVRSAIAEGVGPGVLSRLAVRDHLVLGRLVAVEVAGPPLTGSSPPSGGPTTTRCRPRAPASSRSRRARAGPRMTAT